MGLGILMAGKSIGRLFISMGHELGEQGRQQRRQHLELLLALQRKC